MKPLDPVKPGEVGPHPSARRVGPRLEAVVYVIECLSVAGTLVRLLLLGTALSSPAEKVRHYIDVFVAGMVQAAEPEAGLEGPG